MKNVRSNTVGQAIVFRIQRRPFAGSEKNLAVVEHGTALRSVIPTNLSDFDHGKLAIMIPEGNVVPDGAYFGWMGSGRRKIVRKRRIMGVVSNAIVVPLTWSSKVIDHILRAGVYIGMDVAPILGVYKPLPAEEQKTKKKKNPHRNHPRSNYTLRDRALEVIHQFKLAGCPITANKEGLYYTGKVSQKLHKKMVVVSEEIHKILMSESKPAPTMTPKDDVVAGVSKSMQAQKDRTKAGDEGFESPVRKYAQALAKSDGFDWNAIDEPARVEYTKKASKLWLNGYGKHNDDDGFRIDTLLNYMKNVKGATFTTRENLVQTIRLTIDGLQKFVEETHRCPEKLAGKQCKKDKNHTGPHVADFAI